MVAHGHLLCAFNNWRKGTVLAELLSLPDLNHLMRLQQPNGTASLLMAPHSRILGLHGGTLVLGAAAPAGLLHVWDVSAHASGDGTTTSLTDLTAPSRSFAELQPTGRWPRDSVVAALSLQRSVVVACVASSDLRRTGREAERHVPWWAVGVWDVRTFAMLRDIELPDRMQSPRSFSRQS